MRLFCKMAINTPYVTPLCVIVFILLPGMSTGRKIGSCRLKRCGPRVPDGWPRLQHFWCCCSASHGRLCDSDDSRGVGGGGIVQFNGPLLSRRPVEPPIARLWPQLISPGAVGGHLFFSFFFFPSVHNRTNFLFVIEFV